jgi:hypothetical protein
MQKFLLAFLALVGTISLNAQEKSTVARRMVPVSDLTALNTALASVRPGDVIVMKNGVWQNAVMKLNAAATAADPVSIRAETPGKVILTGNSRIVFMKPYLAVDGLCFKNGSPSSGNVIDFNADHCQLRNTAVIDYNPPDRHKKYYWVYFKGSHNRVSRCYFTGKSNLEPLIGNNRTGAEHNTVDSCYFKNIPYWPDQNGREIFRIWGYGGNDYDHLSKNDGAYFTIAYNLFDKADGEGEEIISLKSNNDKVVHNTIIGTRGGIVNRSGNYNTIADNFILGNDLPGTKGIRVSGRGHRVVNNYVAEVEGTGLIIKAGEYTEKYLTPDYEPVLRKGTRLGRVPMYGWAKNSLFANNTFVNNQGVDINIGDTYKSGWPHRQMVLLPESNTIRNNHIYKKVTDAAVVVVHPDKTPPLDQFSFKPDILKDNILYGGKNEVIKGIKREKYKDPPVKEVPLKPRDVGPFWMNDSTGTTGDSTVILNKPLSISRFLKPAVKRGGFRMDGYFLWCSTVIKVGNTYNMFASRWPAKYGMGGWTKYSEVVRATSDHLYGPYTFRQVVLQKREGHWDNERAHNPKIIKVGDTYVLYYISSANETGYAYSKSIEGPWKRSDAAVMHLSNPAPLVEPDGSIYVFGRKSVNGIRIAQAYTAPTFRGDYTLLNHGKNLLPGDNQLEDPTIWLAGGFYNVICSDFRGDVTGKNKNGVEYYSVDGIHYKPLSAEPVYTKTLLYDDHTTETFKRRERPFVYINGKGQAAALFTACLPEDGPARIIVQPIGPE